jgi:hypothetical protein
LKLISLSVIVVKLGQKQTEITASVGVGGGSEHEARLLTWIPFQIFIDIKRPYAVPLKNDLQIQLCPTEGAYTKESKTTSAGEGYHLPSHFS